MQRRKILIIVRVVRLELGGAEVEEIAGGSEEEEVHTLSLPVRVMWMMRTFRCLLLKT